MRQKNAKVQLKWKGNFWQLQVEAETIKKFVGRDLKTQLKENCN